MFCIFLRNLRSTRTLMNVLHISRITWLRMVHLMVSLVSLRWVSVKFNLISFSLNWEKKLWTIDSLIWFSFTFCLKFWELWIVGLVYVEKLFSCQILFSFFIFISWFIESWNAMILRGQYCQLAAWSASSGTCSFVMNYLLIFLCGNFQLWMSFSILGHI